MGVRVPSLAPKVELEFFMKILNRTSDGLKRCYNVLIAIEELKQAKAAKLQEIAKEMKLPGFRPGKVPVSVAERMYGDYAAAESKKALIDNQSKKILDDENLTISFSFETNTVKEDENGLEFELKFELIPEFKLQAIDKVKLVKKVAEVTDKETEEVLEEIRKHKTKWVDVSADTKAKKDMKVIVDLNILTKIKKSKSDKVEDLQLVLGDASIMEDFWKPLVGCKIGDVKEFDVNYPQNFSNKDFAGKAIRYSASVKNIQKSEEYKIDDEFAKSIGCKDLEEAKTWAKGRAIAKYSEMSNELLKRDLLEELSKLYSFDVPANMFEVEKAEVIKQIKNEAKKLNQEFTKEIEEECGKLAAQRVRLGFIVAKIAKEEKIAVTQNEIQQAVRSVAAMYPGQETRVYEMYRRPGALNAIVGPILESKVVNFLVDKLKPTEEKCSVEALVALDEEPFEFFKKGIEENKKKSASKGKTRVKKEGKAEEAAVSEEK